MIQNLVPNRTPAHLPPSPPASLLIPPNKQSCALECEGYTFFGTQYGIECWCGGTDTDHVQHGESETCNMECSGDPSQICGGEWSMNVYKYGAATAVPSANEGMSTPQCDGVLSTLGYYCCASSCGTCGGSGCGDRDGGAEACCTKDIKAKGAKCEATSGAAPCVMDEYMG